MKIFYKVPADKERNSGLRDLEDAAVDGFGEGVAETFRKIKPIIKIKTHL
jgi:hypothetical protein